MESCLTLIEELNQSLPLAMDDSTLRPLTVINLHSTTKTRPLNKSEK